MYYHVSPQDGLNLLEPRTPAWATVPRDVWDILPEPTTPRVSASPTIEQCMDAMVGGYHETSTFVVYAIEREPDVSNKWICENTCIPDAFETGEVWYLEQVSVQRVGIVGEA